MDERLASARNNWLAWARGNRGWLVAGIALLLLAVALLRAQDRVWWCECGQSNLWSGDAWSRHNSQHLADPYSLTHIVHGVLFYWGLFLVAKERLSPRARFFTAMLIEVGWEIIENTDFVIRRYREATVSLDYFGDSIANSFGDVLFAAGGYILAVSLPVWGSVLVVAALELLLLWWIRDNLLLNVIMLLSPSEAIRNWQAGGR